MPLVSPLTIDDFEKLPQEQAGYHELVDGELVDVSGNTGKHNALRDLLTAMLLFYVKEHKLGRVVSEQEYQFGENAHGPDMRFGPDLAVEIVSENDPFVELVKKVNRYRQCGTREAWILDVDLFDQI